MQSILLLIETIRIFNKTYSIQCKDTIKKDTIVEPEKSDILRVGVQTQNLIQLHHPFFSERKTKNKTIQGRSCRIHARLRIMFCSMLALLFLAA